VKKTLAELLKRVAEMEGKALELVGQCFHSDQVLSQSLTLGKIRKGRIRFVGKGVKI
jgi:hypothetical protein